MESEDTFIRPVYAGNALSTVQSLDSIRLLSVRATAFDAAEIGDSIAPVEAVEVSDAETKKSTWLRDELSTSERPELTSARVVVSVSLSSD